MGIDRIGGYGFGPGYASPRGAEIDAEKVKREISQSRPDALKPEAASVQENAPARSQQGKDAELEDISLTFNKQEGFDYIGRDSDIRGLDMRKAISDMQKDKVIQQYNFFVGSAKNLVENSPDGTVLTKW